MIIKDIHYSKNFIKELNKLPEQIVQMAIEKEKTFRKNPLHPSLRLHELHGKFIGIWSITIAGNYRILFERMGNGDLLFISIGKHDIYKYL